MPTLARLDWICRQLKAGRTGHLSIGPAKYPGKLKVKVTLRHAAEEVVDPVAQIGFSMVLGAVRQLLTQHVSMDRGHRHSSGTSVICFWVNLRNDEDAADMGGRGPDADAGDGEGNEADENPENCNDKGEQMQDEASNEILAGDMHLEHEQLVMEQTKLLQDYIALGEEKELELVAQFLKTRGMPLLQCEHARTCLLQDCIQKAMDRKNTAMKNTARQLQLLKEIIEGPHTIGCSTADAISTVIGVLKTNEKTFDDKVKHITKTVMIAAAEKRKEQEEKYEAMNNG